MITKVALFGSEDLVTQVMCYASEVSKIEVIPFVYQSAEEVSNLISKANHCDVYLFSGVLPYFFTKKNLGPFNKPTAYIEDNELNIALTLLEISNKKIAPLERISIDLPDRELLDLILLQLEIQPTPKFVTDYPWLANDFTKDFVTTDILETHASLWESKQIDFVVTSIHSLYDELVELQIPCMRMVDPKKNIIDALEEAKSLGVLQHAKHSQVAVGLIAFSKTFDSIVSLENLRKKVHYFAKQINCTVQLTDTDTFALYGTRGSIEYLLTNLKLLDDLSSYANDENLPIFIGFGYGMTIIEAESNVQIALNYSQSKKSELPIHMHIVTEDKVVIDVQDDKPKKFILQSQDEDLIQLASEIGISVTNLNKVIQFTNSRPVNRFTSSDIGEYFEVTRRSAERMLKKIADCGYLTVIGEEQPFQHGRPRAIYQLDLPI
ncbi:hypothetical protein ACXYMX_04380 [Sporosarcina sp. CAU 1771]